jgi:oligopeptide/dipeptide ABC transporter ATP-binding protein
MTEAASETGLRVTGLEIGAGTLALVEGVELTVARGEVLGLVGESGSGKSLTIMSLPGLLPRGCRVTGGTIRLGDTDLTAADETLLRTVRGKRIGVVFQDPFTSLNPVRRIGDLMTEVIIRHQGLSKSEATSLAQSALADVGLPDPLRAAMAYPHALSGGQRQRVAIAMALINQPELVIADEPTTALDPTVQVRILDLLRARTRAAATIFVSHDLGAAAYLCDTIAVMYAGRIVERGATAELVRNPRHPYTAALLASIPRLGHTARLQAIGGNPPTPGERAPGCAFSPRCPAADTACNTRPALVALGRAGHLLACHHPGPDTSAQVRA